MGQPSAKAKTRPTIVDGIFYPAERGKLRAMVSELLSQSPTPQGKSFGVISPHAGYAYAGKVMAAAFRSLSLRTVKTAVLIGPVHRDPLDGVFLPESEVFSTPLGPIPVDKGAVEKLLAVSPAFTASDVPHLEEHCLEVQLPFIAHLFPEASIIPLLIGRADVKTVELLSRALQSTLKAAGEGAVYIVSANMASYMLGTDTTKESETVMHLIEGGDWRGVAAAAEKKTTSSCGAAGIAVVLALGEGLRIERLAEADSHQKDGDASRAVHYASYALG